MKIKFTKLPTTDGTIKVSLDGGQSFKDYNIADIHESGIPLEDSQDYEKIQIQAPANVLKNLNVVSSVKVEGDVGQKEQESLPITPIYYQLYDGGCGYGFRIKEASCPFNPEALYVSDGNVTYPSYTSLKQLCQFDGHIYAIQDDDTKRPSGDLYVKADISGSCPYESYYIRVPYRLEEWK